ncbi:phage major capsid protein [Brevundimonas sp.]|uniref:phage major capsid protein n=1 Tax=Brevundimonas sp. TaxID=1871086 RepID=UPI0028AD440E|nr:phage major capsid protein [Brevundimonas sp.]
MNDGERVITGIATTPSPDRMGDIVEPLGAEFAGEIPALWQHNHDQPIGHVKFGKPTTKGIPFTMTLAKTDEPGALKDRLDEAWQSVKLRIVRAVSIGFRAIEYALMDGGGIRFLKIEILELSLVTVPANADCTITSIKSIDTTQRAATGNAVGDEVDLSGATLVAPPPGASGKSAAAIPVVAIRSKPKEAKMSNRTVAEQITAYKDARETKAARMTEIMQAAADKGETLDAEATEEYDGLEGEVKAIDAHLKRLDALDAANKASAKPVDGVVDTKTGSEARSSVRVEVKGANLPKGTAFTRFAMALARSKGNLMQAAEVAKGWSDSTPEVETVLKAAVAAGTTTDADWAKPLVEYQNMTSEFAELLRPQTIVGRIQGLRRVPFNIKVPRQTAGSSASWVGEGAPKPVSELAFDQITLGMTKLAGIVVITDELARASSPSAEAIVRQDLISTIVQTMDRDFVDPANAGTSNVKPASIINGVTPVTASGTDADAVRTDVKGLFAKFIAANLSLEGAVWIMPATQALALSMVTNPLGQPEFNGITAQGGTFFGLPVILSENVPANPGSGSPVTGAGARIILAKASEILVADDGQTMLDVSREASLQMNSTPDNPATASTVLTSLWQHNLVGIRAERFVNWAKRRAGAAQFIDSANYA